MTVAEIQVNCNLRYLLLTNAFPLILVMHPRCSLERTTWTCNNTMQYMYNWTCRDRSSTRYLHLGV